ncbi:hypothetical protein C7974DRAFT_132435 [Boeremia exigua]|uniref:uncharacterized protein n=1 Tax=Boeremia exigua TaxID=749465 RepID=UPI001E8D8D74|nr:uncharacterized protein C7974DRAFT_132435 [Boeremia exigua]KAH6639482.1 hypothetical protein C7974DRAFT_132435 [Boeremia exigua]
MGPSSELEAKYPIGSRPKISFIPYLIFCSYLVSLIGSATTVELLHRRVSGSGWRAWVQIAGCSVSFGLVAIWCMHFVGNRAIVLGDGEAEIQLYYSPAFTTLSAIIPVVAIFLGLMVADRFYKRSKHAAVRIASLVVCGICAGAAITEMHYLGNNGTTNYRLHLNWSHVFGAAGIAVGASLLSFGLFFHWSGLWLNNIARRAVVACFLALAVSGMHWTGAAGTWYEVRGYHNGSGQERNITLIIALCLCLSACFVCFLLGFLKQRHRRLLKDRAQQVVLACATFDENGKLLVSQGGLLPCQTITRQFHQRTFDDEFNNAHPVFQWIFRVSRHWGGIADLVPSMREHLHSTGYLQTTSPSTAAESRSSFSSEDDSTYSATFRELFCVTAYEIAKTLDTSLQNLGCLYGEVVTTGTSMSMARAVFKDAHDRKEILAAEVANKDIETGMANPILFGRGQMLVLTKMANATEVKRLQNLGYHFANIDQVGDNLARSLQVTREDLHEMVESWHTYSKMGPSVPSSGTYLASFLLQPAPGMRGLDIIVPRANPERLPMVKLADGELSLRELKLLVGFNSLSLDDCLARTGQRTGLETEEEDAFLERFRNTMLDLLHDAPESALHRAIFSAKQLDIVHGVAGPQERSPATVFAFCGIKEIYIQSLQSTALKCVPMSFFQTCLRSYPGSPDHQILAIRNHKEFSTLTRTPSITKEPEKRNKRWNFRLRPHRSMSSDMTLQPDSCSEKGLVNPSAEASNIHPWGGIMVTSTQQIVHNNSQKSGSTMELRDMGVKSEAGVADTEQLTLGDRLMSITTAFRDPHATRALPKDLYYGRK